LGAIRAVATAGKPGEFLFYVLYDFTHFPLAKFQKFAHNTSIGKAMKTFETKF